MKIKKIQAKNFRQALSLVKKELGANAVILSSEDKKGKGNYVEVTAAVDNDIDMNIPVQDGCDAAPAGNTPGNGELAELRNEIRSLRECIESMRNNGFELNLPEERKTMFHFLKGKAIKDEFALRIVEKTRSIDDIETIIRDDLHVSRTTENPFVNNKNIQAREGGRIIMLIGPTGVGKTTTIAKLASMAIKERKKVALMSIDTYKIGAAEQIRIYSRMIGIPLDIVSNRDSFRKSIRRFSDRDLILVDTTGQNPKETEYVHSLNGIFEMGIPMETQLLMSSSSDCEFLMNTHKYYKSLPIDSMAFTKTDEAVNLGSIYNLCRVYEKPVAYITTGQRVPGNIEFVDSKKLTNLILRTGSA